MMISETASMLYQTELLIKSIKKYSKVPQNFSLVVQGYELSSRKQPIPLVPIKITNKYINENAEVLYCPYYWRLGTPCRWFIEPKSEMCVFIDVDIIACNDLSSLEELDKNTIYGNTAYFSPLNDQEWLSLEIEKNEQQFYFNMGLIISPSKYIKIIGNELLRIYPEIENKFPDCCYYAGQISLTYIVKKMKIPRKVLEEYTHWYDVCPFESMKKTPMFLHYFTNRNNNHNISSAFADTERNYAKFALNKFNKFL